MYNVGIYIELNSINLNSLFLQTKTIFLAFVL